MRYLFVTVKYYKQKVCTEVPTNKMGLGPKYLNCGGVMVYVVLQPASRGHWVSLKTSVPRMRTCVLATTDMLCR